MLSSRINFIFIFNVLFFLSCSKTDEPKTIFLLPVLTTMPVSNITAVSASCGGLIYAENGLTINSSGVCWSLKAIPTIKDEFTKDEIDLQQTPTVIKKSFNSTLNGLMPDTIYYVRAYATNINGTAYGKQLIFRTSKSFLPSLTTNSVTATSNIDMKMSGQLLSFGGCNIKSKGFCWSETPQPTISSNYKEVTTTNFIHQISNLKSGATYYVRAYAINDVGLAYGNELVVTMPVEDVVGNSYHTVAIGTQTWMVENLKTTKYNDGVIIPYINNYSLTSTTDGYCNYFDNTSNASVYGQLYNWFVVSNSEHCLAPKGWHIPTDGEWTVLSDFIGGLDVAGGKLKAVGTLKWKSPNFGATDEVGFNAQPGGWAYIIYSNISINAVWWTSTCSQDRAWARTLYYDRNTLTRDVYRPVYGLSVRCVRD